VQRLGVRHRRLEPALGDVSLVARAVLLLLPQDDRSSWEIAQQLA